MTPHKIEHTTLVIERDLPGSPRHAFRFWADPTLKERRKGCHADWTVLEEKFDFQPFGKEVKRWRTPENDELTPGDRGTHMKFTEQAVFLMVMVRASNAFSGQKKASTGCSM